MMSSLKTRLLLVPALFLSLPLLMAQAPGGQYNFYFGRWSYPIWDFSGPYSFSHQVGSQTTLAYSLSLSQTLSGSLAGEGTTLVAVGSDVISVSYTATGRVIEGGNLTRVTLEVRLVNDGLDLIAGQYRKFSATLTYNLRVDPNLNDAPALIAPNTGEPVRGSIEIGGLGSSPISPDPAFSLSLPNGVDGSWNCSMDLLALKNRVGGTATITVDSYASLENPVDVATARVMSANVTGSYKVPQGQTQPTVQAALTGLAGSQPSSLRLLFSTSATQPYQMSGKILGQTVTE
jgi:hypothetical protein